MLTIIISSKKEVYLVSVDWLINLFKLTRESFIKQTLGKLIEKHKNINYN